MTAMRSATVIASSWSWVTMTKVSPSFCWRSISSNWVSSRSFLSSAPSGSSSSSTFGFLASERASATRWRWPPESWCGLRLAKGVSLTSVSISSTRALDLGLRHAVLLQAEGDVVLDRHVREERVGLEHHVDRPPVGRHAGEVLPVEQDLARGRLLEAGEHAHQRGLAAAGRAEQGEELALVDDEREIVDGDEIAEALGDVAELDEGLRRGIVPRRELPPDRAERLRRHRYPASRPRRIAAGALLAGLDDWSTSRVIDALQLAGRRGSLVNSWSSVSWLG